MDLSIFFSNKVIGSKVIIRLSHYPTINMQGLKVSGGIVAERRC